MVEAGCPLCAGDARLLYSNVEDFEYFTPAPYDFYCCGTCGLVFMHPLPTRDELPSLYPAGYHNFEPPSNAVSRFLLDRYFAQQTARCARYVPAGGAFLEIGCAGGDILERVERSGAATVKGVELSLHACERAWARGLDVFHGTVDEFDTDERFDLVFMSHVIEHVIDPIATIAKVVELLKPGGIAYVETPNVGALDARVWKQSWGLLHYPRHLYLFDRSTIQRLVESGGLRVERVASELNSCGWALSVQSALRRRGIDRSRRPRSFYYPFLLVALLPLNLLDLVTGGTAFMSVIARRGEN
jgi:2-polyprenyl-3-methyl-5-hydroxy-6-metoxy-1,4-benzoquinol methylase